ncbi:DUF5691 domain-containing protein [Nocardia yamanashiensis]|uniref:DUF5691 domain-containing protein n=1 Tax=Nocardia yamanashiensis TaxID=209247 RepID=UPI001E4C14D2|nr:DUF5691 domain-containing protein [Nocardia yamanashiensis]UGT38575.1 DUF5691 domain-containing protein [Nocardia yamanashiensis]
MAIAGTPESTPPPAAAASPRAATSAEKRHARVTAGLADLDIWLTDQVRTGLAQTDRSYLAFDAVARRMVDAQAPGVAGALRRLPLLTAGPDWPQQLLREYARLHLLAVAHRRLDALSPALRASIRSHIGYSTPVDSVRAQPPVRDQWMVLSTRITSDEALYTRRTLLLGRTTTRWALLIDHHHGSPTFPPDTPPPGHLIEADLHFYPAAAPLRALWGARHTLPDPFTSLPRTALPGEHDAGTIEAALGTYARAVGADPFLRAWPVVLTDVVPVCHENDWHVVESDGTALPVAIGDGEPWRLLGLSGGHPVTVIGEWTAAGFVPLSAFTAGEIVDAGAGEGNPTGLPMSPPAPDTTLAELVSTALVGTARRATHHTELPTPVATLAANLASRPTANSPVTAEQPDSRPATELPPGVEVGVPTSGPATKSPLRPSADEDSAETAAPDFTRARPPHSTVAPTDRTGAAQPDSAGGVSAVVRGMSEPVGDPAVVLLETVGLQDCFARGGVLGGTAELVAVAGEDGRRVLPRAAAGRLAKLLAANSPFLAEWFAAAGPYDYRVPDGLVSVVLERAKGIAAHREPLLRMAGARGRWLAGLHPGWRTLVRADFDDPAVWSHGRPAERRQWLAQVRREDAGAAREALAASWDTESGAGKAELLAILGPGLSLADEDLLERALDDRRAEVRRLAADLLARLPESGFAGRMKQRAAAWLNFGAGPVRPRLTTTGPGVLDDSARRDGVGDSYGYTGYRADGAPDLSGEWLQRVVAGTPLRHWERVLGSAEQAVEVAIAEEMRGALFAGWADAALAQRNPEWARVLFASYAATPAGAADSDKLRELFALQPLPDQIRHLRRLDSSWLAEIESLLRAVPHPWPDAMAEHVLRLLLERAQLSADRPGGPSLVPGSYRTLFRAASAHFPVTAANLVTAIARKCGDPYWEQAFDQLAHDLIQRQTMLEELQ